MGVLNKMGALEDILLITIKANATQAMATFNKLGKTIHSIFGPIKSITGAISTSQRRLEGWKNPIDVVTSKFQSMPGTITGTLSPLFAVKDNIKSITNAVTHSQQRLKGWQNPVDVINAKFGQTTGRVKNIDQIVRQTTKSMDSLNKRARTFDMRLLSLLFGGMALRRAFGGIFRSLFNTFKMSEDESSGLNQATVRLSASWEFLKFSIMDALNTDFFINFIDGLIRTIRWFSQLKDGWKITFLAISGGIFILGTGMMLIGQIKLGWDAIFGMGGFLNSTNKIHAKTLGTNGVLTRITQWAKIGASIFLIWEGIKDWKEGDLAGVFGNLATGVILWTAGLGYAVPFWLTFKGIQFFTPKLQEAIAEAQAGKDFFPETNIVSIIAERLGLGGGSIFGKLLGITPELEKQMDIIFPDEVAQRIMTAKESVDSIADVVDTDLTPIIKTSSDVINNNKDSLNEGLKTTGKEMDIISGEKTEGFITASDNRIQQIEDETAAIERLNAARREELSAFQESFLEQASSVSSD